MLKNDAFSSLVPFKTGFPKVLHKRGRHPFTWHLRRIVPILCTRSLAEQEAFARGEVHDIDQKY